MTSYNLRFEEKISITTLDRMILYKLRLDKHDQKNRIKEQRLIISEEKNYSNIYLLRSYKEGNYIIPLYSIRCTIPNNRRIVDMKDPTVKNYKLVLLNFEFENLEILLVVWVECQREYWSGSIGIS